MKEQPRTYPRTERLGRTNVSLRLMSKADSDRVLEFARALPRHDLLFLRRDISQPAAVEAWLRDIAGGAVTTVLAEVSGRLAGYGTLHRSEQQWSAHVAELRITVGESERGYGLGRLLTQEVFALALERGIEKMVARMTPDQKSAISVFESLGFRPEGLMRDHVRDLDGNKHDLLVLALPVDEFHATLDAYGVTDSLGA